MPVTNFSHPDPYAYQTGFDSYHEYVHLVGKTRRRH